MANGIPVVTSDFSNGIASEIINDGVDGFIAHSDEEFIQKSKRVLSDEDLSESVSKCAIKIQEKLSEESIYKKWEEVLKKAMM